MSKPMSRAEMKDWANETWQKFLDESRNEGKTMTDRELMQQALDALETKGEHHPRVYQAIAALREGLAQPEKKEEWQYVQQLNAFSYPRPWVGLTDEEIKEIIGPWGDTPIKGYTRKLFDQIEAKLKEKNT